MNRIPAAYRPALEDTIISDCYQSCEDIYEDWDEYDTLEAAMSYMDVIVRAVKSGLYRFADGHVPAAVVYVFDQDGRCLDVLEVIDNIWEE